MRWFALDQILVVITKLSQYLHKPTEDHWVAVKRLLRYIKHSINYCLCFRKVTDGLSLIGYCDSDWPSSVDAEGSRRSVTGYCFHLSKSSAALSWKSRKQPTVALSSCEAEYMALASATQEAHFTSNNYLLRLILNLIKLRLSRYLRTIKVP